MERDVKFLSWIQPSAWMECMKGVKWNALVKRENNLFKKKVSEICSKDELLMKAKEFEKKSIFFQYEDIVIKVGAYYEWFYQLNLSKSFNAVDLYLYDSYVYQIKDIAAGSQKYRLECIDGYKSVWHYTNVGPNVIVKDNFVYILTCKNKLWYNSLIILDYKTGKFIKTIYEENDKQFNLSLVKGDNDCIFLLRENSGKQNLFVVEKDVIIYKNIVLQPYFPIGYYNKKICYFYNTANIWYPSGFKFKHTFSNEIEYASLENNILALRDNGLKRIYRFNMKEIYNFYGNLILNKFINNPFHRFFIDDTSSGIQEFSIGFINKVCNQPYCDVKRYFIDSIPIIVSKPYCEVKGLMVVSYGGYGLPTNLSTQRWKPFIEDGWIIAFVCVRGSGDVSKEWANSARTYKKVNAIEDLEQSIFYLQNKFKISYKQTCIYGRSAGGYLIGATLVKNPEGKLFSMIYAEVPYVDILRTTTNPSLPLTILEYDEFGNPANNIYEFEKILELSPVDGLEYYSPPNVSAIVRTSENDSQVYTYESYKWLEALRGKNKNDTRKLLYNSQNQGHFVNNNMNYSEDFFLLKHFRDVKKE